MELLSLKIGTSSNCRNASKMPVKIPAIMLESDAAPVAGGIENQLAVGAPPDAALTAAAPAFAACTMSVCIPAMMAVGKLMAPPIPVIVPSHACGVTADNANPPTIDSLIALINKSNGSVVPATSIKPPAPTCRVTNEMTMIGPYGANNAAKLSSGLKKLS